MDVEVAEEEDPAAEALHRGTLLTAMETAGKTLDEKELSDAMKETGLGTPATRAAIIEVLLKREYIVRQGKSLEATDKGIQLIDVVHPEVKSPAMTGQWEAYLKRIQRGGAQLGAVHGGHRGVRARGGRESGQQAVAAAARRNRRQAVAARSAGQRRRRCRRNAPRRLRHAEPQDRLHRTPARRRSGSPPSAPTRRRSAARRSRAATCCSSCPPARANRSATSCPASRAAAPRS